MRRSLLLAPCLGLAACLSGSPALQDGMGPVVVLADSCATRCEAAAAACDPFDGPACAASCTDGRAACLAEAGFDCFAARRCARPPPTRPFGPGPYGLEVKDRVGPVTLPTDHGPFALEDEWTGDDTYFFLMHAASTRALFAGALEPLLAAAPRHVHLIFGWQTDEPGFQAARARWEGELAGLAPVDRAWWSTRVHFVPQRITDTVGWVAQLLVARAAAPPRYLGNGQAAFAIDRQQRLREVGMLGRLSNGGVEADLAMLAHEAQAFEFEFARDARLAAAPAEVVTLASGQVVHEALEVDAVVPDPARFDTLEVDLALECPRHLDAECGAWDYLSHLHLCAPAPAPDGGATFDCSRELARWITPYWREGRWVTDISAQLPALGAGGPVHLRWTAHGQWDPRPTDYLVTLSLRFRKAGRSERPMSSTPLWTGGPWNAAYDTAHPPRTVDIPADAKRVEIVTLLTGHGGVAPSNCAEFCDHQHTFTVNGVAHRQSFPGARSESGCAERVGEGVVPNQHGTWYFGRGGWCPGQDVAPWVADVTADVVKGRPATLTYRTTYRDAPVSSGLGDIELGSWLVVWK